MDIIQKFINEFNWDVIIKTGLRVSIILVFAWAAMKLLQKFLQRLEKHLMKKVRKTKNLPLNRKNELKLLSA
jgi:hypothetical protein